MSKRQLTISKQDLTHCKRCDRAFDHYIDLRGRAGDTCSHYYSKCGWWLRIDHVIEYILCRPTGKTTDHIGEFLCPKCVDKQTESIKELLDGIG